MSLLYFGLRYAIETTTWFHPRAGKSLLPSKTGQLCNVEIIIKWEWSNYFPLLLSPTPSISHPPVDSDCLKRSIVILLGNQLAITCFTLLNTIIFFLSCSGWERAHSWCWLCWWWSWWSLEQLQLRAGQHQQFQCSRHVLTLTCHRQLSRTYTRDQESSRNTSHPNTDHKDFIIKAPYCAFVLNCLGYDLLWSPQRVSYRNREW